MPANHERALCLRSRPAIILHLIAWVRRVCRWRWFLALALQRKYRAYISFHPERTSINRRQDECRDTRARWIRRKNPLKSYICRNDMCFKRRVWSITEHNIMSRRTRWDGTHPFTVEQRRCSRHFTFNLQPASGDGFAIHFWQTNMNREAQSVLLILTLKTYQPRFNFC